MTHAIITKLNYHSSPPHWTSTGQRAAIIWEREREGLICLIKVKPNRIFWTSPSSIWNIWRDKKRMKGKCGGDDVTWPCIFSHIFCPTSPIDTTKNLLLWIIHEGKMDNYWSDPNEKKRDNISMNVVKIAFISCVGVICTTIRITLSRMRKKRHD